MTYLKMLTITTVLIVIVIIGGTALDYFNEPPVIRGQASLTNVEFKSLVDGKTKAEVIDAVGKPAHVDDGYFPGTQWYYYSNIKVVDQQTGVPTSNTVVMFDSNGVETEVKF